MRPFDEGGVAQTAGDVSGNGNDGTLGSTLGVDANDPAWVCVAGGNALEFDGVDRYVDMGNQASLDFSDVDDFTIAAWIFVDTGTDDRNIAGKKLSQITADPGYTLFFNDPSNVIDFNLSDGVDRYIVRSSAVSFDQWIHVAAVWNYDSEAGTTIYINGVEDKASTIGTFANVGSLSNAVAFRVGTQGNDNADFDGKIDDVRIYDRVLSAAEVAALAASPPAPCTFNLSGTVFEDVDFAGTASDFGGPDVGQDNVDVELYDNTDTYIISVTTSAGGTYTFPGLADGTYKVRARSATIGDADTVPVGTLNASVPGTWPYPLPEMTWANAALIGGQNATVDDTATAATAGPGDTYASVTVSGADVTGVNLGFTYNLIVHTADLGGSNLIANVFVDVDAIAIVCNRQRAGNVRANVVALNDIEVTTIDLYAVAAVAGQDISLTCPGAANDVAAREFKIDTLLGVAPV